MPLSLLAGVLSGRYCMLQEAIGAYRVRGPPTCTRPETRRAHSPPCLFVRQYRDYQHAAVTQVREQVKTHKVQGRVV